MEVLHWRVFWSEVWMGNLQGQYLWVFLLGLVRFPREVILISCQNGTVFVTSILKQEEEKLTFFKVPQLTGSLFYDLWLEVIKSPVLCQAGG